MELGDVVYKKEEYLETATGNKVSRNSTLCGSQNIVLNGRSIIMCGCVFRGDFGVNIRVGRNSIFSSNVVVRPSFKKFSKGSTFLPMSIGDHVFIGESSVILAAAIGNYVHIGKDCVVGKRAVLKDCCVILDNTVLAPDTVVPPFVVMDGNPGRIVQQLPECTQELMTDATKSFYQHFIAKTV